MGFEIFFLKNQNLRDVAFICDDNNDGYIANGSETSIFLKKANEILENGLCTEAELANVATYCPQDIYIRGGKNFHKNGQDRTPDDANIQLYRQECEIEINKILNEKGLANNTTNVKLVMEIIKQKKEIVLNIRIHEKILSELTKKNPKEQLSKRENVITCVVGSSGLLGGIVLGGKIGFTVGGPYGAVAGAAIGGIIGGIGGSIAGYAIHKKTISKEDISKAQADILYKINLEKNEIKNLKERLKNL